jgi:branched-subunit amino acid ABC-type transport system permease component
VLADLVQNTLDGLAAGTAYALLALGFTLIFGVLRRANLSYGPAIMVGCYAASLTHQHFGAGMLTLALVTIAGAVLAGAYVERLCFAPHREGSAIAAMVASFALWMQFEELASLVMPGHLYAFPMLHEGGPLAFGPFTFRIDALLMLVVAILVCASLWWLLYRSRFGLAVRAVIEQPAAASLAGINVPWVLVRVFALASAIGGLAGYLVVGSHGQITPMLGMWATLKGLLAMMLGGLGSLPGAVLGGLALGLIESLGAGYLSSAYKDVFAFIIILVALIFLPDGLAGRRRATERV